MTIAVVDLGSNTIRICVYDYTNGQVNLIFKRKTMAGLANYIKNEKLSNQGIDRACSILNEYAEIILNYKIEKENVYIFATASLRNIVNTKEVIEVIVERTGFQIELLSGEEEATLDFIGATKQVDMSEGILVDIGGGSTELVVFKNNQIQYATSMPIGSLNLYVKYVKKIIPKSEERKIIKQVVLEHMEALEIQQETIEKICGVGGTIRATSKLNNTMNKLPTDNTVIDVPNIRNILKQISNSHKDTITPILQNIPDRIHTIIPGMIVLETICEYFNSNCIMVSKFGIREGYLYERIIKGE